MSPGRGVLRALVGAAGAQLGLRLAGRTSGRVGAARVQADVELARQGGLEIAVPPLGTAILHTHRGPLRMHVMATDVDLDAAGGALEDPIGALAAARADVRRLGRAIAARATVAALAGAAATTAVTLRRRADVAGGVAVGAALLAAAAARAATTVDRHAARDPKLTGLLAKAPLILGDLRTAPDRVLTYRDQLTELLSTGAAVYRKVATLPEPPPADAVRLLHVSDIHLNPAAHALARAVVDEYHVDVVVDTGDLVDWGTPAEQRFADNVKDLGVPYLFVKGNHDSDGIAAAVARQPNATVLTAESGTTTVAGLRFAGMADPRFTPDKMTGDDYAAHRVSEAAVPFAATVDADIVLVHDPAAARALAEAHVPLVLAGHTHKRATRQLGETLLRVEGTTGGSGFRGAQQDPATPITMSVLYVDRQRNRLIAADEITLGGLGSVTLEVQRRTIP